ncbi:MAG: hypothetical protein IPI32_02630 [Austwickia sp.]|nr:hypothetical protein [Austwickia sp.]MBK8437852.1 hypothetical protein [Austwickia sp.]MBK9100159.1 hypothetical protein [Austwickia sp.]
MSVARFIADQRTNYRVPHTISCALLGVSLAWFYEWRRRASGPAAASGLHTSQVACSSVFVRFSAGDQTTSGSPGLG